MPIKGFTYPDGEKVGIDKVVSGEVDVERMGIALPSLIQMTQERDPNRKPSTTELLNGTCQAYLERITDYYIDPQSRAFSLAGTLHHEKLENSAAVLSRLESELPLEHFGWGKKGQPKRMKQFYIDENTIDFGDWGWQLNFYRLLLEKNNYPVDKMLMQLTVRDGGVQIARERGVDRNIYLLEVPKIHDDHLTNKFLSKKVSLESALSSGVMPEQCTEEERWGGNKCRNYCPVSDACIYYEGE
jgi:hypothetical protein